jgi:MacB-like periplasmic core domain
MTQDLLFAAPLLRRQPAFTFVAVVMLALGIGATTAIFGVVDAVVWRPLPFAGSDRIVWIGGRLFTDRDADGSADVVIINASAARRYWPNEDPIGKRISFAFGVARWLEIAGIVGDVKHASLDVDAEPEAYLS